MKILILIFLGLSTFMTDIRCQGIVSKQSQDSISIKSKELKRLYLLSTKSSKEAGSIYKQEFFDKFPNTFKKFNEIYGYYNAKPASLYSEAEKHILELFNALDNINDTLYYKKIVSIAVDGHWDGDAVNYFQDGLRKRVLINPELIIYILKDLPEKKAKSFWYFYFDGPVPKKQIAEPLKRIKLINNKIYALMIEAQNEVLKHSKE